jgi:hypothetical protein
MTNKAAQIVKLVMLTLELNSGETVTNGRLNNVISQVCKLLKGANQMAHSFDIAQAEEELYLRYNVI